MKKDNLKSLSVRIHVNVNNNKITGTGTIIKNNDKYYVFTAYHCIYGKKDNRLATQEDNICIEWKYNNEDNFKQYSVTQIIDKDEANDIIVLGIDSLGIHSFDSSSLYMTCIDYKEASNLIFRGYPSYQKENANSYSINNIENDNSRFIGQVDNLVDNTGFLEIEDTTQGLSGSGVFIEDENGLYLVGIVSSLETTTATFGRICCKKLLNMFQKLNFNVITPNPPKKNNTLTILHISDLEYGKNNNKGLESISKEINEYPHNIDIVLLGGNNCAKSRLNTLPNIINTISSSLDDKIIKKNILMTYGTNEIELNKVKGTINKHVINFKDNEQLNTYIGSNEFSDTYLSSLTAFDEVKNNFENDDPLVLYRIIELPDAKKIAIVTLNAFWIYDGNKRNLLFPLKKIESIYAKIENCSYKVFFMGAQFSEFKNFNRKELRSFIYKNFDFVFLAPKDIKHNPKNNVFYEGCFVSQLPIKHGNKINASITTINYSENKVSHKFIYTTANKNIYSHNESLFSLSQGEIREQQQKLLLTLEEKRENYNKLALGLLVNNEAEDGGSISSDYLDCFLIPQIGEYSQFEKNIQNKKSDSNKYNLIIDNDSKNYFILGNDKSGKTSLLLKLCLDSLDSFGQNKMIPYYLNFKEYEKEQTGFKLEKKLKDYLGGTNAYSQSVINKYSFRFLIDNYNPDNHVSLIKEINEYIRIHPGCSYVIVGRLSTMSEILKGESYNLLTPTVLYIYDQNRQGVLEYVSKNSQEMALNEKEELSTKIYQICKQYHFPLDYWTISLFVKIFASRGTRNDIHIQNNNQLISVYIDEILNKKELAQDQSGFNFTHYNKLLAYIAYRLYNDDKNSTKDPYLISYSKLFELVTEFTTQESRRINKPANKIIEYLIHQQIIVEKKVDLYTFRLEGIFEYFLAKRMFYDEKFVDEILQSTEYVSFRNELDLYSGMITSDTLVIKIYNKSKKKFESLFSRFDNLENIY